MRKTILLLSSVFIFISCENEIANESEQKAEFTVDNQIPYNSPFQVGNCCSATNYEFINESDLHLTMFPHVGLARFDGNANDGHHFGQPIFNSGNFPNIMKGGSEFLNIINCYPVTIDPNNSITVNSVMQLPTTATPPTPKIIQFVNNLGVTTDEKNLLTDYGKIYSFQAIIADPNSGYTMILDEIMKFPFLPSGVTDPSLLSNDWAPVPATKPSSQDLWYNLNTKEICIGNDNTNYPAGGAGLNGMPSVIDFDYNGSQYTIEATISTSGYKILLRNN